MTQLAAGSYFGAVGARIECVAGSACAVVHPEARALPWHEHRNAYFCMLLAGAYEERGRRSPHRYDRFEAAFQPARLAHRDAIGPGGASLLCLELDADAIDASERPVRGAAAPLAGDMSTVLLRIYRDLRGGTLSALVLESATWELCGGLGRAPRRQETGAPGWLRRCVEVVEDEYAAPLTVRDVARRAGVHPVHLSREFRRRFGETLGEYAHKVRVRHACARMADAEASLASIASETGFADQSHFCRVFRALLGCTPSAFRALGTPQPPLLRYSM